MHPELFNNSLFSGYCKRWRENPDSIVFVPIVEFLLSYGMIDDAFKVCRDGLKRHPGLISGRIAMAKIHKRRGNWEEAEEELKHVLSAAPGNRQAEELLKEVAALGKSDGNPPVMRIAPEVSSAATPEFQVEDMKYRLPVSWNTVTMAGIYASQGHVDQAREIYKSILKSDPANDAALAGLEGLGK